MPECERRLSKSIWRLTDSSTNPQWLTVARDRPMEAIPTGGVVFAPDPAMDRGAPNRQDTETDRTPKAWSLIEIATKIRDIRLLAAQCSAAPWRSTS
jgi:hypothetical protein